MEKLFLCFIVFCVSTKYQCQKIWSLEECVKYAETENFKNKQATLNNEILNINVQIAKRESLPSLNAAANNSFNFGQNVLLGTLQRNDNYANSLNLNSSFTLYNHNKIKKNTEKKQLELQGSLFDQESVKNEITVQIIQNYLQILLNKAISKIQEQSVVNSEALYKKSQITTSAGVTPKATEQEAFAELERKKQLYSQSEIDVVKAKMNLANLLQLDDYKTFEIEDIPEYILDINADALSLDEFIKTALTNNPMIKSADYKLKSTELETKILQTNYYPFISINAGLGSFYFNYFNDKYFSNENFISQLKTNFGQQLGVSINIPVFNKGITKLQIEQSKLNWQLANNAYSMAQLQVKQTIQKYYFDVLSASKNLQSALSSEKATQISLDYAERSYLVGRISIYELNLARNNQSNALGSLAQAKFNLIFSYKLLYFYTYLHQNSTI